MAFFARWQKYFYSKQVSYRMIYDWSQPKQEEYINTHSGKNSSKYKNLKTHFYIQYIQCYQWSVLVLITTKYAT